MITALTSRSPEYAQPDITPRRVEPEYLTTARRIMEQQQAWELEVYDDPHADQYVKDFANALARAAEDIYRQACKSYNEGFKVVVAVYPVSEPLEIG